jgi:triphosphoribosyl-dephospho-CoA synthase
MALAADRDLVARQYTDGYQAIFVEGVPALRRGLEEAGTLEDAIIRCHLHLLASHPDSLIARKRGLPEAEEASRRASQLLELPWPQAPGSATALHDFDAWLRDPDHARNPGTTADLVTACLFVALRDGIITVPLPIPWNRGVKHAGTL